MKIRNALSNDGLASLWDNIDWAKTREDLFEKQRRLAALAQCREFEKIKEVQKELINSIEARTLAVAKVYENATQPGVDNIRWKFSWKKMYAALALCSGDYTAIPHRLLIIQSKRGKERNIKIPTMTNRAMQVLYSFALDPVVEVFADKKSFGFRKYRSAIDAHYHVMKLFEEENAAKYVVKADVRSHYETISHKWLLKNVPMDKYVLSEFLKCGHVFDGELFPSEDVGVSIGGSISPVLANFALDGLQDAIFRGLYKKGYIDYKFGNMVRFADDVVIAAKSMNQAKEIIDIVSRFLHVRGMRLSPEKTKVYTTKQGFEFLSRFYQKVQSHALKPTYMS